MIKVICNFGAKLPNCLSDHVPIMQLEILRHKQIVNDRKRQCHGADDLDIGY